jgi:integrase
MRQPIKLIIKKCKVRKDGTSMIFLQYCYSAQRRVLIATGTSIPECYWNKRTSCISQRLPSEYGNVDAMETALREKLRRAESIIDYAVRKTHTCPMRFLNRNFPLADSLKLEQMDDSNRHQDVFYQLDQYIRDKTGLVQPATLTVIRSMKKHLASFETYLGYSITFDVIDAKFYEQFVRYLTYEIPLLRKCQPTKGLMVNTIGKTIRQLKAFLKDRMTKKIIPLIDLGAFKGMEEEVDGVFLDWNELSKVYHMYLSTQPQLVKYRDIFIVGCLTGFRFSDYSSLQYDEFRNGMLHVIQKKTLAPVVVPLRAEAKAILIDKYGMRIPKISHVKFNKYVKEIVRLAGIREPVKMTHKKGTMLVEEIRPKYAWVSSHTCRRSFCTNEYLAGTPIELIMAVSGHKSAKSFRRYIKADGMKKAAMIKEIWDNGPRL